MNVKFSFAQKAIISLLSKVNIKSKNLFYKIWSVWYAIWEYGIKRETLASKLKKIFIRVAQIDILFESVTQKVKVKLLVAGQSFRHFLNQTSNQKLLLPKLLCLVCNMRLSHRKWMSSFHLLKKQSFRCFLK